MRLAYTFVIGDLFHFGHLQLLKTAFESSDKLICGVLSDDAVRDVRGKPIADYHERLAVVEAIRYIDEALPQRTQDPTENLAILMQRFPDAQLVFVCGSQWETIPGQAFMEAHDIPIITQTFYDKLSNKRIFMRSLAEQAGTSAMIDSFVSSITSDDFNHFKEPSLAPVITTKAQTLQALKPLLRQFTIEPTYVFTVSSWERHGTAILQEIADLYSDSDVVVRSSCIDEDGLNISHAGRFHSELGITANNRPMLEDAIRTVIHSYSDSEADGLNQVLVQLQTKHIRRSGVVFTAGLSGNEPYYVITFTADGDSTAVTSGKAARQLIIFKGTPASDLPAHWESLIKAVQEVESLLPLFPLDIEFAQTDSGRDVLFQVRPLAANTGQFKQSLSRPSKLLSKAVREYEKSALSGESVFSDMLFWNPAELIGNAPTPLARSIFHRIFMERAWSKGLIPLGYPDYSNKPLMQCFLYKPYINVAQAFSATLPECIIDRLREPLLNGMQKKLLEHPYLHDKAEYEILFSAYDFSLTERLSKIVGLTDEDRRRICSDLKTFTCKLIGDHDRWSNYLNDEIRPLKDDDLSLDDCYHRVSKSLSFSPVIEALDRCEASGAVPFVTAARLAFIATSILRSLVTQQVINDSELQEIQMSFKTVASTLLSDITLYRQGKLTNAALLSKYGHLRAGTYSISATRYDRGGVDFDSLHGESNVTAISDQTIKKVRPFFEQSELDVTWDEFYRFAETFIMARESIKLSYTNVISDVLEVIKMVGNDYGLTPDDMSLLTLDELMTFFDAPANDWPSKIEAKRNQRLEELAIVLPPLIAGHQDFYYHCTFESRPNFVGTGSVTAKAIHLTANKPSTGIDGSIILIENADPGYHWIFGHGIGGLITKYGGVGSHMAICCAELGIPAAIGCGDAFDKLKCQSQLTIDCASGSLH